LKFRCPFHIKSFWTWFDIWHIHDWNIHEPFILAFRFFTFFLFFPASFINLLIFILNDLFRLLIVDFNWLWSSRLHFRNLSCSSWWCCRFAWSRHRHVNIF
jgi:hypothetical protein